MQTIIHKIRLKDVTLVDAFKTWVEMKDYMACKQLNAVKQFDVHHVSSEANADYHFFEVIRISDMALFEQDMKSEVFAGLVARFEQMADVVEEITGEQIADGYQAS